jgi:hypothetical protein
MQLWLASLTDETLAAPPPRETDQSFPLWYYLVHVVSHGIQELEEAVVLLGASGQSPQNLGSPRLCRHDESTANDPGREDRSNAVRRSSAADRLEGEPLALDRLIAVATAAGRLGSGRLGQ